MLSSTDRRNSGRQSFESILFPKMKIRRVMRKLICILMLALVVSCSHEKAKPRVIVLSDINNIGGDPDDKQSMTHLLMYADEVDIVGIIPDLWEGKGVEATMQCIDAYEKDFNNPGYNFTKMNYPAPEQLRELVSKNKEEAIAAIIRAARTDKTTPFTSSFGEI
jgi:hypothetical protein